MHTPNTWQNKWSAGGWFLVTPKSSRWWQPQFPGSKGCRGHQFRATGTRPDLWVPWLSTACGLNKRSQQTDNQMDAGGPQVADQPRRENRIWFGCLSSRKGRHPGHFQSGRVRTPMPRNDLKRFDRSEVQRNHGWISWLIFFYLFASWISSIGLLGGFTWLDLTWDEAPNWCVWGGNHVVSKCIICS